MLFPILHRMRSAAAAGVVAVLAFITPAAAHGQSATVAIDTAAKAQVIDGFGTCVAGSEAQQSWWQQLYYDDLGASILRMDLLPRFKAPYSDFRYNSPWFHNNPALPGPENNNVRTYTGAADYGRNFSGRQAPIAVMSPDIDANIAFFDFTESGVRSAGLAAQAGESRTQALGDFKLIGSLWSPAPWLKISSGNKIRGQSGILPVNGTAWPFIWGGNFSGGKLDVSDTKLAIFHDGVEPTSALTQFARGTVAYLRGFQNTYGVRFYAISIQNELNFETFYNSCTYPLSSQYIAALKAVRAELERYPDLAPIRIKGPEDLLGGDAYGMWQYGGGATTTHKNLQLLRDIAADPAAAAAVDFFAIHGYAGDGLNSAGSDPKLWSWWKNGWSSSPAAGIPANVKGFQSYAKKSWMTETSGEATPWLSPSSGFPKNGGFSIALKIHQALTAGRQSAWVYWQLTDGSSAGTETLTDSATRNNAPKYVAAKHFFRYIRPGAVRVAANVTGNTSLSASAYADEFENSLTVVLINASSTAVPVTFALPGFPERLASYTRVQSSNGSLWQTSNLAPANQAVSTSVPAYGVVTLHGRGAGFLTWRGENFTREEISSGVAGRNATPAADGIANQTKYALAIADPKSPTQAGLPAVVRTANGTFQMRFLRARAESTYEVQASNDLTTWTTIATNPGAVSTTQQVTVPDDLVKLPPVTGGRRFMRLRLTVP